MSLRIAKLLTQPLAVAAAAMVIHVATAAADSKGDIQQQMGEVLSGTTTAHFAPQSAPHDSKVTTRIVDSQEFVRQLLLGTVASRGGDAKTIKHSEVTGPSRTTEVETRPVAYGDVQAAVRQVLLGQHRASDAS